MGRYQVRLGLARARHLAARRRRPRPGLPRRTGSRLRCGTPTVSAPGWRLPRCVGPRICCPSSGRAGWVARATDGANSRAHACAAGCGGRYAAGELRCSDPSTARPMVRRAGPGDRPVRCGGELHSVTWRAVGWSCMTTTSPAKRRSSDLVVRAAPASIWSTCAVTTSHALGPFPLWTADAEWAAVGPGFAASFAAPCRPAAGSAPLASGGFPPPACARFLRCRRPRRCSPSSRGRTRPLPGCSVDCSPKPRPHRAAPGPARHGSVPVDRRALGRGALAPPPAGGGTARPSGAHVASRSVAALGGRRVGPWTCGAMAAPWCWRTVAAGGAWRCAGPNRTPSADLSSGGGA